MESNIVFILSLLAINIVALVVMIVITVRSTISKDRKIAVYILSAFSPLFGLISFLIFKFSKTNS